MKNDKGIKHLIKFGLTKQEATLYLCLLTEGKLTGYEAAKLTGISRSNAYGSLASLCDKGAAYSEELTAKKYIAVDLNEFCENHLKEIERSQHWLLNNINTLSNDEKGYITIDGNDNIRNKALHLLKQTEERVYISCENIHLHEFEAELQKLIDEKKKVVIITDTKPEILPKAKIYTGKIHENQLGVITDSKYVLTGEYGKGIANTCLYSGQKNFVELYKNALSNQIGLIEYQKGMKE